MRGDPPERQLRSEHSERNYAMSPKDIGTRQIVVLAATALMVVLGPLLALDGDGVLGIALFIFGAAFGTAWFVVPKWPWKH